MDIEELVAKSREKKASDEFIGIVYRKEGRIHFRYRRNFQKLFVPASEYRNYVGDRQYDGIIVWIIESPHKWEFRIDIPLFPTGRQHARPLNNPSTQKFVKPIFEDNLNDFLGSRLEEGQVFLVLLVNSVQYQCSLGEKTSLYRDKSFVGNWLRDGRRDFLRRVGSYGGDIYINSCTKGSINRGFLEKNYNLIEKAGGTFKVREIDGSLGLQGIVEAELESNTLIDGDNYIRYPHPSYFVYQQAKSHSIHFPEPEKISSSSIIHMDYRKEHIQLTIK